MKQTHREVYALCEVAQMALTAVESAGLLTDDRPELSLAVVRRWCVGEADDDEVDDAARAATEAWEAADRAQSGPAYSCVDWLCLTAQDDLAGGVDPETFGYVLANAVECLVLAGENPEAARARAQRVYDAALRSLRKAG